jgi:hypothetical protein
MAFRADLSDIGPDDGPIRVKHLRLNVGATVKTPKSGDSRILIRDT